MRITVLFLVAVACLTPSSARAWNAVGHMIVAKLAVGYLTVDERERLLAALRHHPHFEQYLAAAKPEGVELDAWATMRAGVWPDWIRPPRRFEGDVAAHPIYKFHRGTWHYVNFPYVAHQPSDALPQAPVRAETDILRQIALSSEFASATEKADPDAEPGLTPEQNRAVRLCWLIHLLGDLHQPLHAASLVDERRLPGPDHHDQGGNLLAVRTEIGAYPTRLHGFWDQLPGTDNDPASILELAAELEQQGLQALLQWPELQGAGDLRSCAAESYAAAVKYAYLDGDLPTTVWDESRPPLPAVDDVPILPVGYERRAREIAHRRLVIASIRLGKFLSLALQ